MGCGVRGSILKPEVAARVFGLDAGLVLDSDHQPVGRQKVEDKSKSQRIGFREWLKDFETGLNMLFRGDV